ncbi:WD40 repeat-like protein [Gautieria morchelliformis]|nr:WD40 repeat-like protein [Gautieria morchelliformis]
MPHSYTIEPLAELAGHHEVVWNIAWNPTKRLLASCSADKTVQLYHYTSSFPPKFSLATTIQTEHSRTIRAVAWAPSGETLATASFDSNIGIWERARDGDEDEGQSAHGEWECVSTLEGHETECKSVAYSCTGTLLASCSRDKTVWIWEVQPDVEFECLGVLMHHSQDIKHVAWHPREEMLASASYDDTINIYLDDPDDDWYPVSTLKGHRSTVWCLAWSPCGNYLASSSDDLTVRVWARVRETTGGQRWDCVKTLSGHERSVYSVTWGPGHSSKGTLGWIASAGGDGIINVWELAATDENVVEDRLIARISSAHGVNDVNSISWCSRSGMENILATAGDDCMVRIWQVSPARTG